MIRIAIAIGRLTKNYQGKRLFLSRVVWRLSLIALRACVTSSGLRTIHVRRFAPPASFEDNNVAIGWGQAVLDYSFLARSNLIFEFPGIVYVLGVLWYLQDQRKAILAHQQYSTRFRTFHLKISSGGKSLITTSSLAPPKPAQWEYLEGARKRRTGSKRNMPQTRKKFGVLKDTFGMIIPRASLKHHLRFL